MQRAGGDQDESKRGQHSSDTAALEVSDGGPRSQGFVVGAFENVVKSTLSAAAISMLFFVWSDYIDKQPDLNGTWYFAGTTTDTSYSRYRGLNVTFQVNLLQDGLHLSGYGEKISDSLNGVVTKYIGKSRVHIEVEADIRHSYLSKDTLALTYKEQGSARASSTFMRLVRYNDERMSGTFSSTIADAKGTVEWRRSL